MAAANAGQDELPDFMADIDAALADTGEGAADDFDDFADVNVGNEAEVCFGFCKIPSPTCARILGGLYLSRVGTGDHARRCLKLPPP